MTLLYTGGAHFSGMSRAFLLVSLGALLVMAAPVSGAVFITANASPDVAHIGDVITINGTISGSPTIAVFLFVTGPGLPPKESRLTTSTSLPVGACLPRPRSHCRTASGPIRG